METYHNGSRLVAVDGVVRIYIPGEEYLIVLDVISNRSGGATAIFVDPLR